MYKRNFKSPTSPNSCINTIDYNKKNIKMIPNSCKNSRAKITNMPMNNDLCESDLP